VPPDIPVIYEDEGQEEMGESPIHVDSDEILHNGIRDHLADRPQYRVFSNLNVYYHPTKRRAYFSADTAVFAPTRKLSERMRSYRIGTHGPAPLCTIEVLSQRSFQQTDLTKKPEIYADLRIPEYVLVDVPGHFLPDRLMLKRLRPDGTWSDVQDNDGGVTSSLGFRLIIEPDGKLRVVNAATGRCYVRPDEATEVVSRATEKIQVLEAELERLRAQGVPDSEKSKRRRKT
jgi:Uma2 family endonuclease